MILSASLLLVSCGSENYKDWVTPQHNGEEKNVSANFTAEAAPAIDFNTVTTDSVQLFVPTTTTTDTIVSQKLTAQLANGTATRTIDADKQGRVKADELKAAIESLYGKSGETRQVPVKVTNAYKLGNGLGYRQNAEFTAQITLVAPAFSTMFYEVGAESGWNTPHPLYGPEGDGKYEGWYYLNGEFKFRPNVDNWDNAYGYDGPGKISADQGANCPAPASAGLYRINLNLADGTYSLTAINTLSLIGTIQGNWDTDLDLTYNSADNTWNYTGALNAGEFKIRANHAWDIAWGGRSSGTDYTDITYKDGKNLTIAAAGNYTIRFHLSYETNNKVEIIKN